MRRPDLATHASLRALAVATLGLRIMSFLLGVHLNRISILGVLKLAPLDLSSFEYGSSSPMLGVQSS